MYIKKILKYFIKILSQFKSIKYYFPWRPYRQISIRDQNSFKEILSVWRPDNGMNTVILRWLITEWCNYKCPYCSQNHSRFSPKGKYTVHAFDNYPIEKWLQAFYHHSKQFRISLVITGGEPMLDKRNMVPFLKELTGISNVVCIRIDTNLSWNPLMLNEIDPSKIIFMCTYHPSQTSDQPFYEHLDQLLNLQFKIGMVNYVINKENIDRYYDIKMKMKDRSIPLHPNPLWNSKGQYSQHDLSFLKQELPNLDYLYRTQLMSPYRKKCLFPSLAYEMDQIGTINIGCHHHVKGNFFNPNLPSLFAGPVPCPVKSCVCLDKYSFLIGINRNTSLNPLKIYSNVLLGGNRVVINTQEGEKP